MRVSCHPNFPTNGAEKNQLQERCLLACFGTHGHLSPTHFRFLTFLRPANVGSRRISKFWLLHSVFVLHTSSGQKSPIYIGRSPLTRCSVTSHWKPSSPSKAIPSASSENEGQLWRPLQVLFLEPVIHAPCLQLVSSRVPIPHLPSSTISCP